MGALDYRENLSNSESDKVLDPKSPVVLSPMIKLR
jgi:hypothetical protein